MRAARQGALRCSASLLRWMERPGDCEERRAKRRLLCPVLVFLIVVSAVGLLITARSPGPVQVRNVGGLICLCGFTLGVAAMLMRVNISFTALFTMVGLVATVGVLVIDIGSAAWFRMRMWATVVVAMDGMLVFDAAQGLQYLIIVITMLSLAVTQLENAMPFGLREGVVRFDGGRGGQPLVWQCDCADPPCGGEPVGGSFLAWLISCAIFLADYWMTRRFSVELRSQLDVIAATVRVSERVTQLLAAYATDDARGVVAAEGASLPVALLESYEQLLDNLDSYRVFLPDSLLYQQQQQQQHGQETIFNPHNGVDSGETRLVLSAAELTPARAPPGLGEAQAQVAMCFTDVQSSTELWETHPQGMYTGLNLHNAVMRSVYAACNGYEVKTIGDSFMVAFDSAAAALRFGLEAQLGLFRQKWPEDLLTHPLCQPAHGSDGTPLWSGLRVRIGVQSGPARVERNPVTLRCDYFGPTINTAARLEAVLRVGGLVATSDSVISALDEDGLRLLDSPVVHDAGARELKGVREKVRVWALAPRALGERIKVLTDGEQKHKASGDVTECSQESLSSMASSVASRVHAQRVRQGIDLAGRQLHHSSATCANARLSLTKCLSVQEHYQVFATAAAIAADQTQGVVDGVMSACVAVSWNAARPCADHTAACRRFLGANFRSVAHLGAASGGVLSGSISAGRRSFAAVIGGSVDLAAALAEEAERCGDTALVAGALADECAAAGTAHWAQLWQATGCPPLVVLVVLPTTNEEKWMHCGDVGESGPSRGEKSWADGVAGLFRRACAGEPFGADQQDVLEELRQFEEKTDGTNISALLLAERIASGGVRTRPMAALWDASTCVSIPASIGLAVFDSS